MYGIIIDIKLIYFIKNGGFLLDNNKSSKNKTINFAEKKKAINNKKNQTPSGQSKATTQTKKTESRSVKYDINKMREQINQRTKTNQQMKKASWPKYVYLFALILFTVLLCSRVYDYIVKKDVRESLPSKFVSQSTIVSSSESEEYTKIITKYLNTYVKSNGKLDVDATSIHRNYDHVYIHGYFKYPKDNSKISYDALVIGKDKVKSLVINGYEIIK